MSDAKQLFIDEVMHRALNIALSADPDTNQLKALRVFLQERIYGPVAAKHYLNDEIERHNVIPYDDYAKSMSEGYSTMLYRLDGGCRDE